MNISRDKQFKRYFVDAAKQLSELNEGTNDKEALRYYKLSMDVKDSIFNASSTAQIQAMTFDEQERQREINQTRQKDASQENCALTIAWCR